MPEQPDLEKLERVVSEAIKLAIEYRALTGKPLGITAEVGEFHAAKLLGLELAQARQPCYDAIAPDKRRIQIKARCVLRGSSRSQMLGAIRLDYEWDTVMLVLMDDGFEPHAIYEANRADIERELARPGSKGRSIRGVLAVSNFKAIGALVWGR